jgi:hypothetical protein
MSIFLFLQLLLQTPFRFLTVMMVLMLDLDTFMHQGMIFRVAKDPQVSTFADKLVERV